MIRRLINPELAQILSRHVFEGTNKFLVSGATIPHIEDTSNYNPKALLSPVQKLLVAAPDATEKQADDGEGRLPNLTSDEQEQLFKLLSKSRGEPFPTQEKPVEPTAVSDEFYEVIEDTPE